MAYATEAEWIAAQPNTTGMTPMESKVALESWQVQRPGYVNPMDYQTYEQYALDANPRNKEFGTGSGAELQNQANFYGMTIENYLNALSGDQTKPMGQYQQVYGSQLLSPMEQLAAQTARGQGIGTMSPQTLALAQANPEVFNAASKKWSDYFKATYPKSLEYESVLKGPMVFNAPAVTGGTAGGVTGGTGIVAGGGAGGGAGVTGGLPGGITGGTGVITGGGRTQGLLGEIDNLPLGSYAGSYAPIQKSYENYMAIPAGAQFNPAMTAGGESPYQLLAKKYTGLRNVYEGQVPYTSMGGYNPGLYVDLAQENKRMADITAAQAIQQQLDVLNAGGGDGGGGGGDGGGTGAGAGTGNAMAKGGYVHGGLMFGENPPGPDDGAVNLDIGEYVIKKSSVDKYGKGLLDMINKGKVPAKKMKSLLG